MERKSHTKQLLLPTEQQQQQQLAGGAYRAWLRPSQTYGHLPVQRRTFKYELNQFRVD